MFLLGDIETRTFGDLSLVKDTLYPLITSHAPHWVRRIRITAMETEHSDGRYADLEPYYQYRSCVLTIYPSFLTLDDREQARVILHEIAHILQAPVFCAIERVKAYLGEDFKDFIEALFDPAMEASAEDTAQVILRQYSNDEE